MPAPRSPRSRASWACTRTRFYHWRKRHAQLGTPEIRELRQLRDENTKLKRLVADLTLGQDDAAGRALKKVVKPAACRVLVGHLCGRYQISERRACLAMRFCRASVRYRGKLSPLNGALLARIKGIAAARIRYGYRRAHVLGRREGWRVKVKRVARLYRAEGLSLREKTHRRRKSANVRQPRSVVTAPNQVWSLDFMHDRLADEARRPYRLLTIVDVHTRERLALEPAFAFRGHRRHHCPQQNYRAMRVWSAVDQVRQRNRIYGNGIRSIGVRERRHDRLLAPREADRQRLYRIV